jgi:hypothetical protein
VGDEDGDGAGFAELVCDDGGVGLGARLEVEAGDFGAEDFGDVGEAVAELTDGDGEDFVAFGEGVDEGGFHGAGAGGGVDVDLVFGAEEELEALHDARLHFGELGSPVVDHLLGELGERLRRAGGRAGDTQVLHDGSPFGNDSGDGGIVSRGMVRVNGRLYLCSRSWG